MRQTLLLRSIRWTTGALLLPIIAIPIMAAAQGRQLQFVSTAWSPFTNAPRQPRFALDLVGVALERVGPIAESIISRVNAELRGMIADRSSHRLLHLDWIRADIDGDGRTEYVPHDDQTGPLQPERSYPLFVTGRPTPEPDTTRRFYFGGDIYEGWSTVPQQYKALNFSRPRPSQNTFRIFTFRW